MKAFTPKDNTPKHGILSLYSSLASPANEGGVWKTK
jgi:hypothetical protein